MKRQGLELPSDAALRDLQERVVFWGLVLSAVVGFGAAAFGVWVWA